MDRSYVYVYIDPRNFQEFYYGKGKGARKDAHLSDTSDSEKTARIRAIRDCGLEPIIRVIACDLSDSEALLVEKTLLWKLGKSLTNVSTGHFAANFRPHNTMHQLLSRFDYDRGVYYFNVGECENRNWDDCRRFNFISAGGGPRWRDAILGFKPGDLFVAYLKGAGFVGVGEILQAAQPVRDVVIDNSPILSLPLKESGLGLQVDSDDLCEYVCLVNWLASVPHNEAHWESKSGLYTTPLVRASLDGQPDTIDFADRCFELSIRDLLNADELAVPGTVASLFDDRPKQWGLRGDKYLWRELRHAFTTTAVPDSASALRSMIENAFLELTERSINTTEEMFYIERYAHGGMSSGHISPAFWRQTAIPLILSRLPS